MIKVSALPSFVSMDGSDVKELVKEHSQELTMEDLCQILKQQKEVVGQISWG